MMERRDMSVRLLNMHGIEDSNVLIAVAAPSFRLAVATKEIYYIATQAFTLICI
jgi:hypothetical protein